MVQLPHIIDADIIRLLNNISNGIVLIDESHNEVYQNGTYSNLPDDLKKAIRNSDPSDPPVEFLNAFKNYEISFVTSGKNFYAVVSKIKRENALIGNTLQAIVAAMKEEDNIYCATAKAISKCLEWRWVAVTQFLPGGKVEVLSFWDNGHLSESFIYDIAGTPCQQMAETERFTFYTDLDGVFPNKDMVKKMGAQAYAGLVYYAADNKPFGHIMVFHDDRNVDYKTTNEVLDLACLTLSSHMLHNQTKESLAVAQMEANTDSLTGILNRRAFDDCLNNLQRSTDDSVSNTLVAIFDLDGVKTINDNQGHDEGDIFLQLFAKEIAKLGRANDVSFRIGGDEFAAIFYQSKPAFIEVLSQSVTEIMQRIEAVMGQSVDTSIGFALLSETDGDVRQWVKLADERMYQDKKTKKSF